MHIGIKPDDISHRVVLATSPEGLKDRAAASDLSARLRCVYQHQSRSDAYSSRPAPHGHLLSSDRTQMRYHPDSYQAVHARQQYGAHLSAYQQSVAARPKNPGYSQCALVRLQGLSWFGFSASVQIV